MTQTFGYYGYPTLCYMWVISVPGAICVYCFVKCNNVSLWKWEVLFGAVVHIFSNLKLV